MSSLDDLRAALGDHANKYGPPPSMLAVVKDVDEVNSTVTLIDDDNLEYPDVRLRPVIDSTEGLTLFPKQGTWAMAIRIESSEEWMVVAFGEVDKWRLSIAQTIIEQTGSGLKISNGEDSLKDVLTLIIQAMQQIVVMQGNGPNQQKLLQAQTKLNTILR